MNNHLLGIVPGVVILLVVFIGGYYARKHEKSAWNDGVCPDCITPFKHFDTDSQGGRGYVCQNQHYIWISWLSIDEGKNV